MKIVFMGTPQFCIPILEELIKHHEVLAVVTQPDKAKGRGNKVSFSPVKELAIANRLPILQPDKVKDVEFINHLKSFNADIFVVVAYGKILPEEILYMPRFNSVNVHGSLLPKYRGAAPIHWAIINGEKMTGVTVMYMNKGMDTGDMILKREMEILDSDTTALLYDRMSIEGAVAITQALNLIEEGTDNPEVQVDLEATNAPIIKKQMGRIDFNKTSEEIINLIRGMNPWPCAYTYYGEEVLKIWSAEKTDILGNNIGEIINIVSNKGIIVATSDGSIIITELQANNSKRMLAHEFLNGNKLEVGKCFS
jgi:methionyl-tRNA formyltransferase